MRIIMYTQIFFVIKLGLFKADHTLIIDLSNLYPQFTSMIHTFIQWHCSHQFNKWSYLGNNVIIS